MDATTTQAATGKVYKVQSNGNGPKGMKAGDQVVTAQGTYQINSVRPDGSYDSKLVNKNQTTANYTGTYAAYPGTATKKTTTAAKTTTTAKKPAVPAYAQPYKSDVDYSAQIAAAEAAGDPAAAKYYETLRNIKIDKENLGKQYAKTSKYASYAGELTPERQAQLANGYVRDTTAMTYNPANEINGLLDAWKQGAIDQQNAQIDYAVEQKANELQRAYDDSLPQYQEQRDQVAIDAARAQDNSALYAQARGDNGGIGQSQYNEIQANALKSNQLINNAQVKAATDTARAIADLRAQGEFQKADAMLQVQQQYLSQLMDLKWKGAQYGLTLEQMQQEKERADQNLAIQIANITGEYNGQPTYAAQKNDQATALSLVEALYKTGQPVSKELLAAAGLSQFGGDISRLSNIYASSFSSGGSGGGGSSGRSGGGSGSGGSGAGAGDYIPTGSEPDNSGAAVPKGDSKGQTSVKSSKQNAGNASNKSNITDLSYSPDEGIFTWNGKDYNHVNALKEALNNEGLTGVQEAVLKEKLRKWGFSS